MAIFYTGTDHDTPSLADRDRDRDYDLIEESGRLAAAGVEAQDLQNLADGVRVYYSMQLKEGMRPLPQAQGVLAHKYCGGGYALFLFGASTDRDAFLAAQEAARQVEPYLRSVM